MYKTILNKALVEKEDNHVTGYDSQWRFCGTNRLAHNEDLFFNNRYLGGNEILQQFLTVVKSYEFIGIRVFWLVSNGGVATRNF